MRFEPPRVAIVGAGPGGLAAAMLLARAGVQVKVFEQQGRVGGRTGILEANGFRFDVGPTFFLYPRVLEALFAATGRDLWEEVPMVRLDPQYRLVYGQGGELLATPVPEEMDRRVAALSPEDRGAFQRFVKDHERKLARIRPVLESPFLHWWDLLRPATLKALGAAGLFRSLYKELQRYYTDPRILLTFSFQSKYLGMSPYSCPSLFSILAFLEYGYGVWHPTGGCGAVSEAMARVAGELGAEIALSEPVEEVIFEGRRAVGVRTGSGEHRADAVVINADFARAMRDLVPDRLRRRWTDEKIARRRFSCSCFMVYLGIEGRYDHLSHHTIYICRDYEQNLRDIEKLHVLSEDPSFYVQNASVTDDTLAPKGSSTLYILIPVTQQHPNVDWNRERERYRQVALDQLPKIGIEGVEKRIRFEHVTTPLDWETEQRIHLGATFNLAHSLGQMVYFRPRNRFEDCDGVYLVGGGTHPGSGLPVIYESARMTARLLLGDLGIDSRWIDAVPAR